MSLLGYSIFRSLCSFWSVVCGILWDYVHSLWLALSAALSCTSQGAPLTGADPIPVLGPLHWCGPHSPAPGIESCASPVMRQRCGSALSVDLANWHSAEQGPGKPVSSLAAGTRLTHFYHRPISTARPPPATARADMRSTVT